MVRTVRDRAASFRKHPHKVTTSNLNGSQPHGRIGELGESLFMLMSTVTLSREVLPSVSAGKNRTTQPSRRCGCCCARLCTHLHCRHFWKIQLIRRLSSTATRALKGAGILMAAAEYAEYLRPCESCVFTCAVHACGRVQLGGPAFV